MQRSRDETTPKWRNGDNYRVVCSCQNHQPSGWRSALRIVARGAALLVSIPLALAVVDISSATSTLGLYRDQILPAKPAAPSSLPVFTTEAMKEQFLSSTRPLALDVFKEDYFKRHIPFGDIIYREARRNDLPPELVAAMVHTESDFRPRLVSHKSAQGLMQIVPSTARLLGIDDPFDPEKNIAAGTKYYRYLLDRFDDETMALAAYNAGEGNVARFGGVPPFSETRQYITKVNRRTHRYRENFRDSYIASMRLRRDMH